MVMEMYSSNHNPRSVEEGESAITSTSCRENSTHLELDEGQGKWVIPGMN